MSIEDAVVSAASYQAQLLGSIAEYDDAPAALAQQESQVAELVAQIQDDEKRLQALAANAKKEKRGHESLRDSTARRLAHTLTGKKEKFAARESEEERKYVEALEREFEARDALNVLRGIHRDAKLDDLSEKVRRRRSLKVELSALYGQIFNGPSLAFPEDDELEEQLKVVQEQYDEKRRRMDMESEGADTLTRADRTLSTCREKVSEKLDYTRWALSSYLDMEERSVFRQARELAHQVQLLVREAQSSCPSVGDIGELPVSQRQVKQRQLISEHG
ncbi:hypothetical protein AMATHDRAFT_148956 [Amanita thiersii Skay4041]|uniref:Uncharacterized protein n=1 Tax=Amanita thiersii Skay4041 TaxID=703135 RepID=A0A2A9NM68_9AGAR|nr:hypothetical protein AMATHDRAFT_148956 [Amanita thiersii Skay4041]